jgi:hypothetical protein
VLPRIANRKSEQEKWNAIFGFPRILPICATVAGQPCWNRERGFSDDIVIIVGSALVVSAAVGRSGIIKLMMRPFIPHQCNTLVMGPGGYHFGDY